jgi:putative SOS response-associated peptidase YedK
MLTVNADGHPLMGRFHAPEDEKRSVVVVAPERHAEWIGARREDEARTLLAPLDPAEFTAEPAPLTRSRRRASPT